MKFQEWVSNLIAQRYGTMTALAHAIGMQLSPFTRGVTSGTLNIDNLLKLAEVTQTPALDVLRIAGKTETADRLERLLRSGLFALPDEKALTASQREVQDLLAEWKELPETSRKAHLHLMRSERRRQQPPGRAPAAPPDLPDVFPVPRRARRRPRAGDG